MSVKAAPDWPESRSFLPRDAHIMHYSANCKARSCYRMSSVASRHAESGPYYDEKGLAASTYQGNLKVPGDG